MAKDEFENDEELREVRVLAERQLDDLLAIAKDDLPDMRSEERFLFLLTLIRRLDLHPMTGWSVMVVAIERIIMKEQLDSDLSPD